MEVFSLINIGGTIAFAASGTLAGLQKRLDGFGLIVVAFATAVGGGTIRDMLIGRLPVRWLQDSSVILLICAVALLTIFFRTQTGRLERSLVLFDSLGLGFFTLRGLQEGVAAGLNVPSCIILGTITACFGGVLRDIVLNEIPLLFRREIYATACMAGGVAFFLLRPHLPPTLTDTLVVALVFGIRIWAIRKNISLPQIEP
ncbi:trimeric intracellular cation channel family protein [Tellurirhabdus rosea]|uniref:trimeric intracellular cation channel family protein n=1 Tax=Tellurirhabdus rosea TaxID=2674997 RepID=UPI002253FE49|nr:trimeric intracellular cation channel family protein [Tellurirhabdus rosea]